MAILLKRLLAFARDSRGVVGMIFGLTLVPMIGMIGLAVDYSVAVRVNSSLRAAADTAALASARAYVDAAPDNPTTASISAAIAKAKQRGGNLFDSNAPSSAISPSVSINMTVNGLKVTSTATYSGAAPTYFTKIFRFNSVGVSGSVTASLDMPNYQNFYVVIDNSQSMGLGSTLKDMEALASVTLCERDCANMENRADEENCVFGCHIISSKQQGHFLVSNEQAARANKIRLRIDDAIGATQDMLTSAQHNFLAQNFKFALYTMQFDNLTTVAALSSNYASLQDAASGIGLGDLEAGYPGGDSDLQAPLASLAALLPRSGNGQSAATAKNYVFIVTDGVQDNYSEHGVVTQYCIYRHCVKPFDKDWCDGIKRTGATLGVIYTTYLRFPGDRRYDQWVANIIDDVTPNLQACASPGYFFEASDGPAIHEKVAAAFAKTMLTPPRLTQ